MRNLTRPSLCAFACVLLAALCGSAQKAPAGSVTWELNRTDRVGGHPTTVVGDPKVTKAPVGKAILFDGVDDGLQVGVNPIAGARAFTIEAVFRPDPGGAKEQRWLHLQDDSADNRVLLETRLAGGEWFLDTFIKSGAGSRTLYAENFKHPLGRWYHVALVYDGRLMRHYVEGREELSGPLDAPPLGAGKTSIGVRLNRVHWFKGAVGRVRFTPRALAPREFIRKGPKQK